MSDPTDVRRHPFAFAAAYRLPALAVGVTPRTAVVEVSPGSLHVRFGPWRLRTELTNIADVTLTGGFAFVKTAGPPHLSFTDRGITFATNGERAVCLTLHEPVRGIEPTGRITHPGVTLTVLDPELLRSDLRELGVA